MEESACKKAKTTPRKTTPIKCSPFPTSGISTSSDCHYIPQYVSDWKSGGFSIKNCSGDLVGHRVYDPLHVKLRHVNFFPNIDKYLDQPCQYISSKCSSTRDNTPDPAGTFNCPRLTENEIMLLQTISDNICFNIDKSMYRDNHSNVTYRGKLPHGAWPEQVTVDQKNAWHQELEASISRLENLKRKALERASDQVDCNLEDEMCSYEAAKRFLQEVDCYLHVQPRIREDGFTHLFKAFIEVVGLKDIRNGRSISASEMIIYGKQTISEPDLLIFQPYNAATIEVSRERRLIAVAEIKATCGPQSTENSDANMPGHKPHKMYDTYEPACAQMFGELLLEMPNALIKNHLLGFLVMGTEVTLCHLHIPQELLHFYQTQGTNPGKYKGKQFACYTVAEDGLDILKSGDRLRLWKCFARLKHL